MTRKFKLIISCFLLLGTIIACSPAPTETGNSSTSNSNNVPVEVPTGWKTIVGNGVSLSLPSRYEGGNPGKDIKQLEEKLSAINPSYTERIEPIKQRTKAIALIAFEPQNSEIKTINNVSVIKDNIPENTDKKSTIETAIRKISSVYEIVETEDFTVNDYPGKKIIAQADSQGDLIQILLYLLVDQDNLWLVTYTTTATEFEQLLPDFEKSVQTFRVEAKSE